MKTALKITRTKDKKFSVIFGIKLKGIRVLPAEERGHYENFVIRQIGRQMDVINCLHESPVLHTTELRYLYHPDRPHQIDVYFLVRVIEPQKQKAIETAFWFHDYFFNQLMVNNQHHEFERVTEESVLAFLIDPFEFNDLAEIVRREAYIPLDISHTLRSKPVGFCIPSRIAASHKEKPGKADIYYVFPFSLTLNNMERLCHILYLQKNPMLVSVRLQPYKITEQDENLFLDRLVQCEKYAQLPLEKERYDHNDRILPYLRNRAAKLYHHCAKNLSEFLDAAFLQKIQIVSSTSLPHDVISVLGATLTEHTGHPKLIFSDKNENEFIGGYEYHCPASPEQRKKAFENFKNMEFSSWIPTIADNQNSHWRYLFNVSQASAGFRIPISIASSFPGIDTWQYQIKSAPSDLPGEGLFIGQNSLFNKSQNIYLKTDDRRQHSYIVGQTGTGKSTLFQSMILQDIQAGEGAAIIDPHGELIEKILKNIPPNRKEDVIYFNPGDLEFPIGINLLDAKGALEKDFCVNYLIEIFDLLYNLRETGGPMFELYIRNCLQLLLDQPEGFYPTVLQVPKIFQDREFRKLLLQNCTNQFVKDFWENEAEKVVDDARLENISPYITSKLTRFVYNTMVRGVVGQRRSSINFRSILDEKKILLVDLRKGLLGETNSSFLGMLVVGKIFSAALSRTTAENKSSLPDFYLYVDEFQNLATPTFAAILSEARKYKLALTLANQYASQINEKIINGIFGNVGTLISFRVGLKDAEMISGEFGKQVSQNDLMGVSNFTAYTRLLIDGARYSPFNIRTILPETKEDPELAKEILELSRKKYGRPIKEVEESVAATWDLEN